MLRGTDEKRLALQRLAFLENDSLQPPISAFETRDPIFPDLDLQLLQMLELFGGEPARAIGA
jgi:hypothetical protein